MLIEERSLSFLVSMVVLNFNKIFQKANLPVEALKIKLSDLPYFSEEQEKSLNSAMAENILRKHLGIMQNVKDVEISGDTAIIYFEGISDEELLRSKSTASVLYFLDTLDRFKSLTPDKIREISFEIGLLAQHGVEYDSAKQRYNLRSLPNERFTALQLMAMMFAGFRLIEPALDIGVDLQDEYNVALKLHEGSKG
jgi:hypothetical protein